MKARRLLLLCFLLLITLPRFAAADPPWDPLAGHPAVDALYQKADQSDGNDAATREKLYLAALDKATGDSYASAVVLSEMAGYFRWHGPKDKTLEYADRAVSAWEGVSGPEATSAGRWDAVGGCYEVLEQYDKALEAHALALPLLTAGGYEFLAGLALQDMGRDCHVLGRDEEALTYFSRSQEVLIKRGDKGRQNACLLDMGVSATSLGRYDKALVFLDRALETRDDNAGAYAVCLTCMGRVYFLMGQLDRAIGYYKHALEIYQANFATKEAAQTTLSLGVAYCSARDYVRAEDLLASALAVSLLVGNRRAVAGCSLGLGMTAWYQGDYAGARGSFARALQAGRDSGDRMITGLSRIGLGMSDVEMGRSAEALPLIQQATATFEQMGNKTFLAAAYASEGAAYESLRQWDKASDADEKAIDAVEAATFQVNDPTEVGALLDMLPHPYARAAAVRLARGQAAEALTVLERGRGQGLARQAAIARVDFSHLLSPDDAQALKASGNEVNTARSLLKAAKDQPEPQDAAQQAALQRRRDEATARANEAERQHDLLRDLLFARYPQFKRLQSLQPVALEDLRALAARSPDTLYLEWGLLDDRRTLLFALSQKDGVRGWALPVGEKKLTRMTEAWRTAIGAEDGGEASSAHALSAVLFAPLSGAGYLAHGRYARLVLVADGGLLNVRFAALIPEGGGRLIDRYALSSAVSLGVLTWTRTAPNPTRTMLCVADPLGDETPASAVQVAARWRGEALGPLPYARTEARAVAALVPGTVTLVGGAAREADVKAQIGQYGVLHFATHGLLDAANPMRSGLVLAPEPAGSPEDGVLDAGEILTLPLTARLAVLSACRTAEGKSGGGEGLMGLSWAFQAAGCPSVLASQWSVSDQATGRLMTEFYRGLTCGLRRDEALRRAMLAVRASPGNASPRRWAAFRLIGEAGTLSPTSSP